MLNAFLDIFRAKTYIHFTKPDDFQLKKIILKNPINQYIKWHIKCKMNVLNLAKSDETGMIVKKMYYLLENKLNFSQTI